MGLLVCLLVAIVSLLGTRTSLLDTVGINGSESARGASTWCAPRGLPTLASTDRRDLLQLREGLLRVFAVTRGSGYSGGVIAPEDMWSDNSPLGSRASRLADGRWPAGYEVRWWTRYYDLVADVLVFGTPRQALAFFGQAAGTDCHRDGVRQPAPWPSQARNLAWVNPDHASQNDAFLLRGRRVYRVAAVRLNDAPKETARVQRRVGTKLVDLLACILPGADCPAGGAVTVDYSGSVGKAGGSPVNCAAIESRLVGETQAVICSRSARSASATISAARLGSPRASRCACWAIRRAAA
jgi:hypothetical protein